MPNLLWYIVVLEVEPFIYFRNWNILQEESVMTEVYKNVLCIKKDKWRKQNKA